MGRKAAMIVRITGLLLILLGVMVWMGNAGGLVPIHMGIGLVFVIAMWVLGFDALRSRVVPALAGLLLLWGAAVLAFGMIQAQVMPGANHGAVQLVHVIMGLIGMGMSEAVGKRLKLAQGSATA